MSDKNWSRKELIVAFNLYCKTPSSKINASNSSVKELAPILGRSASAVALKLANFARLDPSLQQRNISGMTHESKSEVEIWNEFSSNWEELAYQSKKILANFKDNTIESTAEINIEDLPDEGKERESFVKTRVNQSFFRKTILASYDNRCCITGMSIPDLLVASHNIPWAVDIKNRMNPCNGLCLNALHDKAFDKGFITITPDYKLKISKELESLHRESNAFLLSSYCNKIALPRRFLPAKEFLEYYNKFVFTG